MRRRGLGLTDALCCANLQVSFGTCNDVAQLYNVLRKNGVCQTMSHMIWPVACLACPWCAIVDLAVQSPPCGWVPLCGVVGVAI